MNDIHCDYWHLVLPDANAYERFFPNSKLDRLPGGRFNYKNTYEDRDTGMRLYTGGSDARMGALVQAGGQALERLRGLVGYGDEMLTRAAISHGGRFTRYDLAYTCNGLSSYPRNLFEMLESGKVKTTARKWSLVQSGGEGIGDTCYVGGRTSANFFRCYNKTAEQGHGSKSTFADVRFEVECHEQAAGDLARMVASLGTLVAFISKMAQIFPDGLPMLEGLADGVDVQTFAPVGRKQTNTQKWLEETVAVTLRKEVMADPEFYGIIKAIYSSIFTEGEKWHNRLISGMESESGGPPSTEG